jgi:hypothetical protein
MDQLFFAYLPAFTAFIGLLHAPMPLVPGLLRCLLCCMAFATNNPGHVQGLLLCLIANMQSDKISCVGGCLAVPLCCLLGARCLLYTASHCCTVLYRAVLCCVLQEAWQALWRTHVLPKMEDDLKLAAKDEDLHRCVGCVGCAFSSGVFLLVDASGGFLFCGCSFHTE